MTARRPKMLLSVLLASMGLSAGALAQSPQSELKLHVPSPDWRDQIIYFVLTDRFNDGDPDNNDQGAGEYDPSDHRRYSGGDLAGITQRLDYIQALGATALWLTPPVANQWWYPRGQYGGYHGYWARDFTRVDPHYGTLAQYQALSDQLHRRGMYLIQDIVANHTGNFFGYEGPYDIEDTAKHFVHFADDHPGNRFPSQAPFDRTDRLNPEHAAADIYHWTPPISDYGDPVQEFTYQLANLADLNTGHPEVRAALKASYRYWIETVGVDAFRVDTVKYVEHDFWHDFFHAPDGIQAAARASGRDHFLAFGEVFDGSAPMDNAGERKLARFLGSAERPELNSVIGFPLYFELDRVLAQGAPTAQLAYRLEQQMAIYPDPYVIPNFVNNHDTPRFLASGSEAAFRQAMAVLFTVPGIPVIYQGDEQALKHTRQAMFAGGYGSDVDQFDTNSPMFSFIRDLAALRTTNKALTRGTLTVLAANEAGPGVLAFERAHQGERLLVLLNSADRPQLVANLPLAAGQWQPLLDESGAVGAGANALMSPGQLTTTLPARAVRVYRLQGSTDASATAAGLLTPPVLTTALSGQTLTQDTELSGRFEHPDSPLYLVIDGDVARAEPIAVAEDGQWRHTLQVRDLGLSTHRLTLYAPTLALASDPIPYQSHVREPQWRTQMSAPAGDERYARPTHALSGGQRDLLGAEVEAGGANLTLTLRLAEITDSWQPINGFDNVSFGLFFDLSAQWPERPAIRALPELNATMPEGARWHLGHRLFGWGNGLFTAEGACAQRTGVQVGPVPRIEVDKAAGTLTSHYQGAPLGVSHWRGARLYITTWDRTGEGALRPLEPVAGPWAFGGGSAESPRIMDALWLTLPQ
ncbi:alpha-amylase family glycosyl hydrolase [Ferrimonas balearica]|uniref:alpha-amylase family glycosyl hydrolase n=1 Tax=Ferrimonas balearica TaxID=44012 RepID=UPI001C9966E7|nr:alpha-amylase family glycosyl hydrolase [Ferrimonas balearica]MBY5990789.1 DUF3459 domain-containing protein [Ferrimonas balearica]